MSYKYCNEYKNTNRVMLNSYDNQLRAVFGVNTFRTISKMPNIVRVNFNDSSLEEIKAEALDLIKKLFDDDDFLVRITFWDKYDKNKYLLNCIHIEEKEDCSVGIFKFKLADVIFEEFIKEHLNYELGIEPCINITAYLFDISKKTLLNIYDDRGADYLIL